MCIEEFAWDDLDADGVTEMGKAFNLVADQLTTPMSDRAAACTAFSRTVSQLMTTMKLCAGYCACRERSLSNRNLNRFDADDSVLQEFTGNRELVLQANNPRLS